MLNLTPKTPNAVLRTVSFAGELLSVEPIYIETLGENPSEESFNSLPTFTLASGDIQDFGPIHWLDEDGDEEEY